MKNRKPEPTLIFDNGENNMKIKRAVALNREAEVEKRVEELRQKWPEKTIEGEQYSVLGNTFSNASPEMIVQYNASRRKFIEDSEKKIWLEVERDDLQLRMKEISILIYNKGTASTGKMNIFIYIPENIKLYRDNCKRNVDYDEPSTPSYRSYVKVIPSLSRFTPKIEMWDMVDYIRDDQLISTFEPLNHKLQYGLHTLYVDSATCPNFKLKWILVDAELPDPVKGELNVSFVDE